MARNTTRDDAPWEHENPKQKTGERTTKLSSGEKSAARARARRAGRPYPNLVDNMRAAAKKSGGAKKSRAAKSPPAKKSPASKSPTKQPAAKAPMRGRPAPKKAPARKSSGRGR
jgi:hypothetical protein